MKEYVYYWYHHMMPEVERKRIHNIIKNKNYDEFIKQYKKYSILAIQQGHYNKELNEWFPMIYLPTGISVFNTETDELEDEYLCILNKQDFEKITYDECECG